MQVQKLEKSDPLAIKFSNVKRAYFVAKALSDTLREDTQKLNAPIDRAVENKEISVEAWAEQTTENEYKTGYADSLNILWEVKKTLLEMGKEITLKLATKEQYATVKKLWTDGLRFVHIRKKLLELTLQLDPTL